ncbi:MAG: class I SAM-dependent methyltransferase [bacterium]|nr:class I SAM-dependent methyltransferase [bacterium]
MIEGRPSDTALQVAAAREAHRRFDAGPPILDDVHAASLLDEAGLALVETYGDEAPWILLENRLFLPLRARLVEDRLAEAYARGVRQYVILGAGLDSYAWRQPEDQGELRIYEVDHPATQQWKADRLTGLGWPTPANTRMVACDFEATSASEALSATDFDPAQPTVVSWMGVIYYLERETAADAMADLAKILAPGSELVFDVMLPWEAMPERYQAIREQMVAWLKGAGEPQKNRYRPPELVDASSAAGFDETAVIDVPSLYARYASGEPASPLSERFFLAIATR